MTKDEIKELEEKIEALKKDVELWKKFRELADEVERLKNKPTVVIPYQPNYVPNYPWCPTITTYPLYTIA